VNDSPEPTNPARTGTSDNSDLQVSVNDCWSRIGVSGDGSCPELQHHFHCRNCPVYSAAGAQLLERSLLPDYRRDWALHFARPKQTITAGEISVVLFRLGTEWLGLPTDSFQEVAEMRKIHTIPHRRKGVLLGIVNVRGELVLCVALDKILGLSRTTEKSGDRAVYERLLVASAESRRIAFPVDEVHGVHRFNADALRDPPATLSKSGASYTLGVLPWNGKLTICLDAELLFPALNESIA
jgi:chemotaxis-related protein WspD